MAIKWFLVLAFYLAVDVCLVQSHALPEDGGVDEEVTDGYTLPRQAAEDVEDFEGENIEAGQHPEREKTQTLMNQNALQGNLIPEQTGDLHADEGGLVYRRAFYPCKAAYFVGPAYPDTILKAPVLSNRECFWTFVASRGKRLMLKFIEHDVSCSSRDLMEIVYSRPYARERKCGQQLDEPVVSINNVLRVEFVTSDASTSSFTATVELFQGCPQNWSFSEETKNCYKHFGSFSFEIGEAEQFCQSLGGGIAMPKTQSQQDFLIDLSGGNIWIALYDTDMDGTFTWGDGEPVIYSNWDEDEPLEGADSASMVNGGKWIGEFRNAFSLTYNVVCQVALTDITDNAETADPEYFF